MIKSKSSILKSLGKWNYDEIKISEPNQDQAIVKIISCGICSTDIVRSMKTGFYLYPIVPGHEMIGNVYKLGEKNSFLKEGDKVCIYPLITKCTDDYCCAQVHGLYGYGRAANLCSDYDFLGSRSHGGYSEYVLSPIRNLVKIPKNLNDDLAVFTEPASVALHAYNVAKKDRQFDTVIILGLGPIGILLASWCKLNKIKNVIGVDRNQNRFKNFKDLGFKNIIDTNKDDFSSKLNDYTSNKGVEIAFECSGSVELLNKGILSLSKRGKIIVLSNQTKDITLDQKILNKFLRQEIRIVGSWSSVIEPHNEWLETLDALNSGKFSIKGLISHKYKFSDAKNIFPDLFEKKFKYSKILLQP